jgi:hypothetical protein
VVYKVGFAIKIIGMKDYRPAQCGHVLPITVTSFWVQTGIKDYNTAQCERVLLTALTSF